MIFGLPCRLLQEVAAVPRPIQTFQYVEQYPTSLFFSRLNSSRCLSLSSYAPSSFTDLSHVCPCLSCTGEHRTGCSIPGCGITSAKQRGRITSLNLLEIFLLMQPRIPSAGFAAKAHWCHRFNLMPQNHRMLGVGRDLCGPSSPTLLLKQGYLQQAAQDFVQADLEYLQRERIHNLPGQPVSGLHHPQSEKVLPHVQTELPVLQFVPFAPCPVAGHH